MTPREKNRAMSADLQAAINQICDKYGLERTPITLKYARDGSFFRISRVDIAAKNMAQAETSVPKMKLPQGEIDAAMARALARLGVTKVVNSKGEKIVAYKPNRPKYPFVFEGPRGGKWKATEADIKRMFA